MKYKNSILFLATLTTALVAGTFYAFSIAINPAFKNLDDVSYIQAMQAINKAIVNPFFAFSFFGSPAFLTWAVIIHHKERTTLKYWLLLSACVIYLAGGLGVTVFANIPMNEALSGIKVSSISKPQIAMLRKEFMMDWNGWHTVRTAASIVSLFLLIKAGLLTKARVE